MYRTILYYAGVLVIIIIPPFSIILSVYIFKDKKLSDLENILFQVILSACSVIASVIITNIYARSNTVAITHAKSAIRRLVTMYWSVVKAQNSSYSKQAMDVLLDNLRATLNDSWQDWRDVVPDEIRKLEKLLKSRVAGNSDQDEIEKLPLIEEKKEQEIKK